METGLTLSATAQNPIYLNLRSIDADGNNGAADNFDPAAPYSWEIIGGPTGIAGFDVAAVDINAANFAGAADLEFTVAVSSSGMKLVLLYRADLAPKLPGDTNDDCVVNVLDMILVRNKLNDDPSSGDLWWVDVTEDGHINVLDMILIRNQLNDTCDGD